MQNKKKANVPLSYSNLLKYFKDKFYNFDPKTFRFVGGIPLRI